MKTKRKTCGDCANWMGNGERGTCRVPIPVWVYRQLEPLVGIERTIVRKDADHPEWCRFFAGKGERRGALDELLWTDPSFLIQQAGTFTVTRTSNRKKRGAK